MDAIRSREAARRDYRDPVPFLKRLRVIEHRLMDAPLDAQVRTLRTNKLKEWREARLGALFCHGMSERMGQKVFLSKGEFEDADFVGMWFDGDVQHFAPVQIKELVPEELNSRVTLDTLVQGLSIYSGRKDLTVLIHLNRRAHFKPESLVLPPQLPIAALWVLACTDSTQSEWAIWGNFLEQVEGTRFAYPA
ncbi:hypothetical protein [Hydrogenophaga sp.]|uniref:hypothetical protein n=1 Tax=Hydrogenophaga sp. TaxID=1904254 RepID=UPI002731178D|nr:hypothetical protein [Hydrogenophaga sp.]MDP2015373.1 hypothetical protein [Hydrogenophaga sp.]MDP3168557.1 hypothetical protein [Hydrogenophaga sp.]